MKDNKIADELSSTRKRNTLDLENRRLNTAEKMHKYRPILNVSKHAKPTIACSLCGCHRIVCKHKGAAGGGIACF